MTDDASHIDASLTKWPATLIPIEARLDMLQGDFPELVRIARDTLNDERYSRQQAEQSVDAMIRAEATWQNARHHRFTAEWVAGQLRKLEQRMQARAR